LFDTKTGQTFNLNRTGAFILRGLMDGTTPQELCASLVERFEVEQDVAARDVDQFIFRLRDLNLADKSESVQ
jgi:hypothetical protein